MGRWWKREATPEGSLLGVPEPRPFRKAPHEAYTAQAYFYIFWWYRGTRWAWIVTLWMAVVSAIAYVWWPSPLAAWILGASVILAVCAGLVAVLIAFLEPTPAATYISYDDESVTP